MSDSAKLKCITSEAVLSYPYLDKPQEGKKGAKPKYSCSLVFLPGTDIDELKKAALAVAEAKHPGKAAKMFESGSLRSPFRRDAEEKGYPEGSVFINVRTEQQPGLVLRTPDPATGKPQTVAAADIKSVFYPGAKVRASVVPFYYDTDGNKGVSFALNNLQKLGEGTRLDNRQKAEDEFDADLSAAPASLADVLALA